MSSFRPDVINDVPVPYQSSIEEIRNAIKSTDAQAWVAIRALAEKNDPEALAILIELTKSSDWRFRRSAAEAIGISPLGKQASIHIERLLYDPGEYVQRTAIEVVASLGLNHAHERILTLTKAHAQSTRIVALSALGTLWHPTDFDFVFDIYLHDRSDEVRKQAAWTIASNVESDHWRQLFSEWSKDSISRHRIWACELIKTFGKPEDTQMLSPLIHDHDGHVRKRAKQIAGFLDSSDNFLSK
jgi:HEAT repeat protein